MVANVIESTFQPEAVAISLEKGGFACVWEKEPLDKAKVAEEVEDLGYEMEPIQWYDLVFAFACVL